MRLLTLAAAVVFAAFSTLAPSPDPTETGFIGTVGDTTVVFAETLVRTDDALKGTLALFGNANIHAGYTAELAPGARIRSLALWQRPLDAADVQQSFRVEIGDDSVRMIVEVPAVSEQAFPVEQDVVPYVNPSIGLLEHVVRRAMALGDEPVVTVPLLYLSGQNEVLDAEVRFVTPDSIHVVVVVGDAVSSTALRIDDAGHVLGGGSVEGPFRFRRVSYDEAAALLPPAMDME